MKRKTTFRISLTFGFRLSSDTASSFDQKSKFKEILRLNWVDICYVRFSWVCLGTRGVLGAQKFSKISLTFCFVTFIKYL